MQAKNLRSDGLILALFLYPHKKGFWLELLHILKAHLGKDLFLSSLQQLLARFSSLKVVGLRPSVSYWLLSRGYPQSFAMWASPTRQLTSSKPAIECQQDESRVFYNLILEVTFQAKSQAAPAILLDVLPPLCGLGFIGVLGWPLSSQLFCPSCPSWTPSWGSGECVQLPLTLLCLRRPQSPEQVSVHAADFETSRSSADSRVRAELTCPLDKNEIKEGLRQVL